MKTKYLLRAVTASCGLFTAVNPALGQTWTQTSAPLTNWTSVACSADGSKLVATANGTFPGNVGPIYVSTNSGATWTPTSAPVINWASVASSAEGTKLAAVGSDGVHTSADSGMTWTAISGPGGRQIVSSADGTKLMVASGALFASTNTGASWTPLPAGGWCVASSADGCTLASAFFNNNGFPMGCICVSTDCWATWRNSAPLGFWTGWTALASSADGKILAATLGHTAFPTPPGPIYVSTNSGEAWMATSAPSLDWSSVACSADGTKLVAASFLGGVYTSVDSGVTWTSNSVPWMNWSSVACSADGSKLFAASGEFQTGGIYTLQSTPTPKLNLTKAGGSLLLSWTVPSLPFVLQESADLTTTNWTDVPTPPTLNLTNLQNQVTVPPPSDNRFYRLKH